MGLYVTECPQCKKPYQWFSGNPDQRCEECVRNQEEDGFLDFDLKTIYLKKEGKLIGIHAMGYEGPYTFTVTHVDGSQEEVTTDFKSLEMWGNEYNDKLQMIGKGSFRVFSITLEHAAQDFEADGWVRFTVPKEDGI